MAGSVRPEDVAIKSFKSGWRGYDSGDVDSFLKEVSSALTSLQNENDRLLERLRKLGDRDLHAEFDQVSTEIGELLHGARETAEGMRLRASLDAEHIVGDAHDDAVKLRQDAWNEGTALLEDSHEEAAALIDKAKRDSLAIISDAERDAHRIVTKARKDAEESVRRAKLQVDQTLVEARSRKEELTRDGESEVAAAQERVAVLMQRRVELLAEIESVQSKIDELRAELEERRAEIGKIRAVDTATVKVLPGPAGDGKKETPRPSEIWQQGEERIRIVRPPKRLKTPTAEIDAEDMAAEVRRLRYSPEPPPADVEEQVEEAEPDAPEPEAREPEAREPEAREPMRPAEQAAVEAPADIDDLFASLRSGPPQNPPPLEAAVETAEPPQAQPEAKARTVLATDPFELRDHLLLPVTNKTLRTLKRALTEAQNIALDELRIKEDAWGPDADDLEAKVADDFGELVRRSASAGRSGAERLLGREFEETEDAIESSAAHDFADTIVAGVRSALETAGDGPRQRAAAISRVYRAWRVDEAERCVRNEAIGAYHQGLINAFRQADIAQVQWVVSGRGCVTCRAMAEAGPLTPGAVFDSDTNRPPAHESCSCTLVPV